MKPDTNDPRPAYVQVADDLRASIADRMLKPGDRLPSGRDLARRYGVAPMTISHAVDVLRKEKLVEAYPGRGVFIADHSAPGPARDDARQDPAITSLRSDLDRLAERVARLEHVLGDDPAVAEMLEHADRGYGYAVATGQLTVEGKTVESKYSSEHHGETEVTITPADPETVGAEQLAERADPL